MDKQEKRRNSVLGCDEIWMDVDDAGGEGFGAGVALGLVRPVQACRVVGACHHSKFAPLLQDRVYGVRSKVISLWGLAPLDEQSPLRNASCTRTKITVLTTQNHSSLYEVVFRGTLKCTCAPQWTPGADLRPRSKCSTRTTAV